jgi:hypothetical protein
MAHIWPNEEIFHITGLKKTLIPMHLLLTIKHYASVMMVDHIVGGCVHKASGAGIN